jgi:hypothetical protein
MDMSLFFRITAVVVLIWSLIAQLYILAGLIALWYLLKFKAYELIIVAILIDGYYQAFYTMPYLSFGTLILVVIFNIIKPQLLMYTGDNEMVS